VPAPAGPSSTSRTPENVEALYAARERLETAAVARTPSPEQLSAITAAFDALAEAARSRDSRRIVEHDLAFHSAIVALLDSSRLDGFYAELTRELRFYLMALSVQDREFDNPGVVLAEYDAILSAIRSGDRDRAVAEVRAHIETNAQRLKRSSPSASDTAARGLGRSSAAPIPIGEFPGLPVSLTGAGLNSPSQGGRYSPEPSSR
jgi:DNA-binding GntR family transcriptional regulator